MGNTVAIVGRPNVGKSTLFNRLVGKRKAIVDNVSGVTRDRLYDLCEWNGKTFTVIDTGGYVYGSEDVFEAAIREQVLLAVEEAAVIVFVLDVQTGITEEDEQFAKILRKVDKPIYVAANKTDDSNDLWSSSELYRLGFKEIFPIAAISGYGTGELLDVVSEHMHKSETFLKEEQNVSFDEETDDEALERAIAETANELPKFCVLGRPNVGKSTFVNTLLGEERNIVADIAGTTRDALHSKYKKFDREFLLVDTAGLRKKSSKQDDIEFYSVMRAINAMEGADVCWLMIDASEGMTSQDVNIAYLALKRNKGLVVLVNKWDAVEKDTHSTKAIQDHIRLKLAPFEDVSVIFISALHKQRVLKALDTAIEVYHNRRRKVPTAQLNALLQELLAKSPPPSVKGKFMKIKYVTQVKVAPPVFAFFCNLPQYIKESYKRYLENNLRKKYNFQGVPIKLVFKRK